MLGTSVRLLDSSRAEPPVWTWTVPQTGPAPAELLLCPTLSAPAITTAYMPTIVDGPFVAHHWDAAVTNSVAADGTWTPVVGNPATATLRGTATVVASGGGVRTPTGGFIGTGPAPVAPHGCAFVVACTVHAPAKAMRTLLAVRRPPDLVGNVILRSDDGARSMHTWVFLDGVGWHGTQYAAPLVLDQPQVWAFRPGVAPPTRQGCRDPRPQYNAGHVVQVSPDGHAVVTVIPNFTSTPDATTGLTLGGYTGTVETGDCTFHEVVVYEAGVIHPDGLRDVQQALAAKWVRRSS